MAIVKRVDSELELWKPVNGDLIYEVLKNNGFFNLNSLSEDGSKIIDQTQKILQVAVNPNKNPKNNTPFILNNSIFFKLIFLKGLFFRVIHKYTTGAIKSALVVVELWLTRGIHPFL